MLVEGTEDGASPGRGAHQAPETDGVVTLDVDAPVGTLVAATVVDSIGIDLIAEAK